LSIGRCARVRKNRVLRPALTPTLSPRRGGAMGDCRKMVTPFSAFLSFRLTCRTAAGLDRGDLRSSFQENSTRVPSSGGEGWGEGGPIISLSILS
jgi:hypothetical protein